MYTRHCNEKKMMSDNTVETLIHVNSYSKVIAFFDVDETLITIKSMFDFFDYWVTVKKLPDLKQKFYTAFMQARAEEKTREELNRLYYQFFSGYSLEDVTKVGLSWFESNVATQSVFIRKTIQRFYEHQAARDKIVFVSGSMLPLLQPMADFLDADDILCTELIVDEEGILTGEIGEIQTIGVGKSKAMNLFAIKNNIELSACYAYGDDVSDIPMLLAVGNPVFVGKQPIMLEYASKNRWQILN